MYIVYKNTYLFYLRLFNFLWKILIIDRANQKISLNLKTSTIQGSFILKKSTTFFLTYFFLLAIYITTTTTSSFFHLESHFISSYSQIGEKTSYQVAFRGLRAKQVKVLLYLYSLRPFSLSPPLFCKQSCLHFQIPPQKIWKFLSCIWLK